MIGTDGLIWLGASVTYPAGWLLTARMLYGRWRYQQIERGGTFPHCWLPHNSYERHRCCAKKDVNRELNPHWLISLAACVTALVWPGALLVLAVTVRPRQHPKEIEAAEKKRKAYIAELEKDLERSRRALDG